MWVGMWGGCLPTCPFRLAMWGRMAKKAAGLTALVVRQAGPGTHVDGDGLMLVVRPSGSATWTLRYQLSGRRRDMGLGPARGLGAVTLADARDRAAAARRLIRDGIDPLDHRDRQAAEAEAAAAEGAAEAAARDRTFQKVAALYIASHEGGWRNAKHAAQWSASLAAHAYPHIGAVPVADVGTPHVLAALEPIWRTKTETASRLRGRIEAILDYARVQGWREGENPARWRGHLDHLLPKRSKVARVEHHPALPWQRMPAFVRALRRKPGHGARALLFAILTATRSGEVRGMTWREVDLEGGMWTVPASRMKAGKEHRVPLSPAAVDVLWDQSPEAGKPDPDDLVFPGQRQGRPLSDMTLSALVRGMATDGLKPGEPPRWCDAAGAVVVPHGFRSTFRDWAAETTAHPREVAEAALAHTLESRVEAAYRRGDLLEKRRRLMEEWAIFCTQKATADSSSNG